MEKIVDYLAEELKAERRQATRQRKAGKKDRISSLHNGAVSFWKRW